MLGYTGTYKGVPVSVMASGMGMPSMGIYSWELYNFFGVQTIIRVGSAGSYKEGLDVMDVTLVERAVTESNYALAQNGETAKTAYPSTSLNESIRRKASELGINLKSSTANCTDAFYHEELWQDIVDRTGADCVEMESFALFHNASVLDKQAACLLTISDSFVTEDELSAEERQLLFADMIRIALETAIINKATGLSETTTSNAVRGNGKFVENNRIVIYKDGKRYNTNGIE